MTVSPTIIQEPPPDTLPVSPIPQFRFWPRNGETSDPRYYEVLGWLHGKPESPVIPYAFLPNEEGEQLSGIALWHKRTNGNGQLTQPQGVDFITINGSEHGKNFITMLNGIICEQFPGIQGGCPDTELGMKYANIERDTAIQIRQGILEQCFALPISEALTSEAREVMVAERMRIAANYILAHYDKYQLLSGKAPTIETQYAQLVADYTGKNEVDLQLRTNGVDITTMGFRSDFKTGVLTELLNNAYQYGRPLKGMPRIDVSLHNGGETATLIVCDNGTGIHPDVLDLLFREDARPQSSHDGNMHYGGFGIDLVGRDATRLGGQVLVLTKGPDGGIYYKTTSNSVPVNFQGIINSLPADFGTAVFVEMPKDNMIMNAS